MMSGGAESGIAGIRAGGEKPGQKNKHGLGNARVADGLHAVLANPAIFPPPNAAAWRYRTTVSFCVRICDPAASRKK